jgi:amino acid transporter
VSPGLALEADSNALRLSDGPAPEATVSGLSHDAIDQAPGVSIDRWDNLGETAGAIDLSRIGRTSRHIDVLAPALEARRGVHPGDRAVRVRRPKIAGVRRLEPGVYEIVSDPESTSSTAHLLRRLRRALLGAPIRTEDEGHERLTKPKALAVFGSDNISSSAYASEEVMRVLVTAGAAAVALTLPLSMAVVALLVIVVVSYMQTIRAYPKGGGSYIVSSDNLGVIPGLVAGASIQVGYVLTVAVSVSAGVAALTSAFPTLYENRVPIAVVAVAIMAWGNLRGIRESGSLFAAPAYLYLVAIFGLLGYGLFRYATGDVPSYVPSTEDASKVSDVAHGGAIQALSMFLVLRAFASGAVGLTGTEAIADGVGAFTPPESRNARVVLGVMAACFGTIFLGISFLSGWIGIIPDPHEVETVNSQLTRALVGIGPYYYVVQFATALLLVLAANTAFADFPRLAYFLARDKFLPSHFAYQGAKLAFSNGIIILAVVAAALIVFFRGSVTGLLPLYGIGVFTAFTLSQAALVRRWLRLREPGWQWRMAINSVGTVVTALVTVIVGVTKFTAGAWVVLILIPGLVMLLLSIRRHFEDVREQLSIDPRDLGLHADALTPQFHHYVLIPVADMNRSALRAITYARSLTGQARSGEWNGEGSAPSRDPHATNQAIIQAVHITDSIEDADQMQKRWEEYDPGVELVVIDAPYRSLVGPLLRYIDVIERRYPDGSAMVTVLLPEFVPAHWWEYLLHTQTALMIKGALLFRSRTVVTSVPYHLHG